MTIIWVSTSGSDTTGNGSRDLPYATLEKAIDNFSSGDQIRILDGKYIPTDSLVISGLEGSIFAENKDTVTIQPIKTEKHQAVIAIINSPRFHVQGINILQASNTNNSFIGLYAEDVDKFLCYTVNVTGFDVPSGNAYGIYAFGSLGRIENCSVSDIICGGDTLRGIKTSGFDVIDCSVLELSGTSNCDVVPIEIGFVPGDVTPGGNTPAIQPYEADPTASWWYFNGVDAYLILGNGSMEQDWLPADSFSIVMLANKDNAAGDSCLANKRYGAAVGNRVWDLRHRLCQFTGNNNFDYPLTSLINPAGMTTLYAMTVNHVGAANNEEYLYQINSVIGQDKKSSLILPWPPQQNAGIDVYLAGEVIDEAPMTINYFKGHLYWAAFYNSQLSDANLNALYNGTAKPWDFSPMCYVDFHKAVGATYESEISSGTNAPYIWNVVGTPILNGP